MVVWLFIRRNLFGEPLTSLEGIMAYGEIVTDRFVLMRCAKISFA